MAARNVGGSARQLDVHPRPSVSAVGPYVCPRARWLCAGLCILIHLAVGLFRSPELFPVDSQIGWDVCFPCFEACRAKERTLLTQAAQETFDPESGVGPRSVYRCASDFFWNTGLPKLFVKCSRTNTHNHSASRCQGWVAFSNILPTVSQIGVCHGAAGMFACGVLRSQLYLRYKITVTRILVESGALTVQLEVHLPTGNDVGRSICALLSRLRISPVSFCAPMWFCVSARLRQAPATGEYLLCTAAPDGRLPDSWAHAAVETLFSMELFRGILFYVLVPPMVWAGPEQKEPARVVPVSPLQ